MLIDFSEHIFNMPECVQLETCPTVHIALYQLMLIQSSKKHQLEIYPNNWQVH